MELHNHGIEEQSQLVPELIRLAKKFDLKTIASNDVHYVKGEDWAPHDALLCIQTGSKLDDVNRMRYEAREFYLKSREEMEELFREVPESITNTFAVAEMCDVKLPFGENNYPVFTLPPEIKTEVNDSVQYLQNLCIEGLHKRYEVAYQEVDDRSDEDSRAKELSERLDYELGVIGKTGFNDYFLIVADFMQWSRDQGIPVGPGRGSGAGCLVAYVLGITDIDPLRFGLLFERFLNPERVSPPTLILISVCAEEARLLNMFVKSMVVIVSPTSLPSVLSGPRWSSGMWPVSATFLTPRLINWLK